jgi:hypothetical protein
MWRGLWRIFRRYREYWAEAESGELESGGMWIRPALRSAFVFALLFGCVCFVFWWAGSAVRFSAARAAARATATWRVSGKVRDAVTHEPIPWALVEDDPAGQPPFFHADADDRRVFELLTLAESHRIRVSAPGYSTISLDMGRVWFIWLPRGERKEKHRIAATSFPSTPQMGVQPSTPQNKATYEKRYPLKCVANNKYKC